MVAPARASSRGRHHGGVAELADAGVLKTPVGRRVGSSPTAPTIYRDSRSYGLGTANERRRYALMRSGALMSASSIFSDCVASAPVRKGTPFT